MTLSAYLSNYYDTLWGVLTDTDDLCDEVPRPPELSMALSERDALCSQLQRFCAHGTTSSFEMGKALRHALNNADAAVAEFLLNRGAPTRWTYSDGEQVSALDILDHIALQESFCTTPDEALLADVLHTAMVLARTMSTSYAGYCLSVDAVHRTVQLSLLKAKF